MIKEAKEKLPLIFTHNKFTFSDDKWNITEKNTRTSGYSASVNFHLLNGKGSIPVHLKDVLKAYIILTFTTDGVAIHAIAHARYFCDFILKQEKELGRTFCWSDLSQEHLHEIESKLIQTERKASTIYGIMSTLKHLARYLSARHICPPIQYTPRTKNPQSESIDNIVTRRKRMEHLIPSPAAINGLAQLYCQPNLPPHERLITAGCAILFLTGLRITELLTLPFDCIVETSNGTKIRYYIEKTGSPDDMYSRVVPSPMDELLLNAVNHIKELTQSARDRAKILETNPGRVPIPGFPLHETITPRDIATIYGYAGVEGKPNRLLIDLPKYKDREAKSKYRPGESTAPGIYCKVSDLEEKLLTRVKRLWTIRFANRTLQPLSESLFVLHPNFFNPERITDPLISRPVWYRTFSDQINGSGSIFARHDIREPDGSVSSIRSHQFRHNIQFLAEQGGMSISDITVWMGRTSERQSLQYSHRTKKQEIDEFQQAVRDAKLAGPVVDTYHNLPESEAEIFLQARTQNVQTTTMGFCTHNFKSAPCPYGIQCFRGCEDFLCNSENNVHQENTRALLARNRKILAIYEQREKDGTYPVNEAAKNDLLLQIHNQEAALNAYQNNSSNQDGLTKPSNFITIEQFLKEIDNG